MSMEDMIVTPIRSSEIVLSTLGRKTANGGKLTTAESLMALSASASAAGDNYGPSPADMVVKTPDLPEYVKGLLANYAS